MINQGSSPKNLTCPVFVTLAKLEADARSYDIPFNAGFGPDFTGEDIVVQTYGELVVSRSGSFTGFEGYIDTPSVGQSIFMQVEKNGVGIASANPYFNASSNTLSSYGTVKSDGTEDFVSGDRITFKLVQVGTTTAGQKLRFTVKAVLT